MSPRLSRRAFCQGGLLSLGALSPLSALAASDSDLHGRQVAVMGTRATVVVRHPDPRTASEAIRAAVAELFAVHEAMTLFEPSPLVALNRRAGAGVLDLDPLTWTLLCLSQDLRQRSAGRFDPSLADRTPAPALPALAAPRLGFAWLGFDRARAQLHMDKGARLDLNAVAKGHAVDRAVQTLRRRGLRHFVVNAGGDLYVAGHQDGTSGGWAVRVRDSQGRIHELGHLSDRAIATSGLRPRGPQRSWLLNPQDGRQVQPRGSITVVGSSAAEVDGWATALAVSSPDQQARLARQLALSALVSGDAGLSPLSPLAVSWRGQV